jgi:hypothetical protein
MFNEISWATYAQTVTFSLFIYYFFVLYRYYRQDLLVKITGKQRYTSNSMAFNSTRQQPPFQQEFNFNETVFFPKENKNGGYSPLAQALTDELQAFISEAGSNSFERQQILPSLQLLIGKYPSVKSSPFKESIKKQIAQQCASTCSVHLSEEELDGLWVQ